MFALSLMSDKLFFFGDWQVDPSANSVRRGDTLRSLEPKAMDVLLLLCRRGGEVVSADELLEQCWRGQPHGDNPIHKAINQLRKAFDCDASAPRYIETIRKRGYRAIAPIAFPIGTATTGNAADWRGGSPFPGLRAFTAQDADVFFGRGEQIAALLRAVTKQIEFGRAFCLVLGPSGSGKTSLVAAGVLPNLMAAYGFDGQRIFSSSSFDLADAPPERWLLDIAGCFIDWELNDEPAFPGRSAEQLAEALRVDPQVVCDSLHRFDASELQAPHKRARVRFALVLDRLEALFAPDVADETRERVLTVIDAASRSGSILVLATCRNDFYPQVSRHSVLMTGKSQGAHFDLQPPSRAEWLQMIRLPAAAAGLVWEADPQTGQSLDDILCHDIGHNSDALPLLQYTLQELYLQRDSEQRMRTAVYRELGGLEGAIGRRANAVVAALPDATQAALTRLLSLVVTLGADETTVTSRSARFAELHSDDEKQLVHALVDNRLFVTKLQGEDAGFSVAHEALLRSWPRVADWLAAHREALNIHARVAKQAERWQAEKQNTELLLGQGKPLAEAKVLLSDTLPIEDSTRRFVRASMARAQRWKRARQGVVAALVTLTLLSAGMGWRANEQEKIAQQKRTEAEGLMGFMVGDLADRLKAIERMDLLDGVTEKAMSYLDGTDDGGTSVAGLQQAKTLLALTQVSISRGRTDAAHKALARADVLLQRQHEARPTDLDVLKQLGAAAYWRGSLARRAKNDAAAEAAYRSYLDYAQKMRELAPDSVDAMIEESYATNNLGNIFLKQGNVEGAIAQFEASIGLKQQALHVAPKNETLAIDTVDSMSWLANAHLSNGDLQKAQHLRQRAKLELESRLTLTHDSARMNFKMAMLSGQLAMTNRLLGQHDASSMLYQEALKYIDKSLKQDPDNKDFLHQKQYFALEIAHDKIIMEQRRAGFDKNKNRDIGALYPVLSDRAESRHPLYWNGLRTLDTCIHASSLCSASVQADGENILRQAEKNIDKDVVAFLDLWLSSALYGKAETSHVVQNGAETVLRLLQQHEPSNKDPRVLALKALALKCLPDHQEEYETVITHLKKAGFQSARHLALLPNLKFMQGNNP